jgi:hypothetical protein
MVSWSAFQQSYNLAWLEAWFWSGSYNFAPSILAHPLLLFPDGHDVDKCLDKKGLRAVVVAPRWWSQP